MVQMIKRMEGKVHRIATTIVLVVVLALAITNLAIAAPPGSGHHKICYQVQSQNLSYWVCKTV